MKVPNSYPPVAAGITKNATKNARLIAAVWFVLRALRATGGGFRMAAQERPVARCCRFSYDGPAKSEKKTPNGWEQKIEKIMG